MQPHVDPWQGSCYRSGMDVILREIGRVRSALADGFISKRALARQAGLRDTNLIGVERDAWNPTSSTLSALSRALDDMGYAKACALRGPR